VALQGTLDTFALPDVLRLLASTKKSGRLRVSGNRGTGSVWVDSGGVVASEATGLRGPSSPVDVLFELLRYGDGSFTFEAGTAAASPSAPTDVEPLLVDAERQLLEWREIEAVVPSMDAWVNLAQALPRPEIVIDSDQWKTIVAVGSGTTVDSIGRVLDLGEVAVCRLIKDLVELGLGSVSRAPGGATANGSAPARDHSIDLDELASHDEVDSAHEAPFSIEIPGVDEAPAEHHDIDVVAASNGNALSNGTASSNSASSNGGSSNGNGSGHEPVTEPAEADEVARQLASLSPKAARAVAAAARAETDEEREAALAEVTGDDDEPINRGLLLKFLSSVRS
jgi:hypothetical protein